MHVRMAAFVFVLLLLAPSAPAKNKRKQTLPDYLLKAHTLAVVLDPNAGEPLTTPTANRTAREIVEKALTKWGRFTLVPDARSADVIVVVRKGNEGGQTIHNAPGDDRPVIYQAGDGNVRIGAQRGRSPHLTKPGLEGSRDRGPHVGNEIGPAETFEVYRGGVEYPLDSPSVWRYMGKNALNEPRVTAVEEFRTAINDSEQQRKQKP